MPSAALLIKQVIMFLGYISNESFMKYVGFVKFCEAMTRKLNLNCCPIIFFIAISPGLFFLSPLLYPSLSPPINVLKDAYAFGNVVGFDA